MRNLTADILVISLTKLDGSCPNSGQKDVNIRRVFKQASPGFNEICKNLINLTVKFHSYHEFFRTSSFQPG